MRVYCQRTILTSICRSAESSGFTFTFEKSENVTFSHGAFDVSDKSSVDSSLELNLNLRNTSSWAYSKHERHQIGEYEALIWITSDGKVMMRLTGFADDFFDDSVYDFTRVHIAIVGVIINNKTILRYSI